jgi:hypothetical protein
LLTHTRRADRQRTRQLPRATRLLSQQIDNATPGRIGERSEHLVQVAASHHAPAFDIRCMKNQR